MSARWDSGEPESWQQAIVQFLAFLVVAAGFFLAITAT